MHPDTQKAKMLLADSDYTCVLCKGDRVLTSRLRGVAPLMSFWKEKEDISGFFAADKVVGKATALLYCLLGVQQIYATVMSRPALLVLQAHGIPAFYEQLVDAIQNRTGDGFCPMETATRDIEDPALAPDAIEKALQALKGKTTG